jgi:lipoprotein NlpD
MRSDYQPRTYVVRPGDTLYSIAWRLNMDYRNLARWNDLGPGYRIAVGQILSLRPGPYATARAPASRPAPSAPLPRSSQGALSPPPAFSVPPSSSAPQPPSSPQPSSQPPSPPYEPAASGAAEVQPPARADAATPAPNAQGWVWPTAHLRPPRLVEGGGILLLGELGQPVRAARAGRVAYVGSGIRGYGNLIIIKHGENLLTAYAHTRELTVREGQDVLGGQVIARMGSGPHQIAALYFEVRLNGKPVDPLPYLTGAK